MLKKARLGRFVLFIFFLLALVLLFFLIKNNWDIMAAVNELLPGK